MDGLVSAARAGIADVSARAQATVRTQCPSWKITKAGDKWGCKGVTPLERNFRGLFFIIRPVGRMIHSTTNDTAVINRSAAHASLCSSYNFKKSNYYRGFVEASFIVSITVFSFRKFSSTLLNATVDKRGCKGVAPLKRKRQNKFTRKRWLYRQLLTLQRTVSKFLKELMK